ncbi:RES family NAD+ phosphorylase [Gemmobacter nectariphilus]|uniref:RES family NAD+ phosphorylase n=1 Tax=Gemmobacter nectariphilus TaxID=220343 RepID=UPI0003FC19CB|nr:RES family NAD+ phosphorylase [Gemmobacter nectariphilus]
MPNASWPVTDLSGRFWRILPVAADPLSPAPSPEGRFHHSAQRALYCSPTAQAAGHAVAPYLRPGDLRLAVPLRLTGARIADLRDPATLAALGLQGHETAVPWLPERAAGQPATTWRASDAARAAGACGMIYTARSAPDRWHLVLFRWNTASGAQLAPDGPALPHPH